MKTLKKFLLLVQAVLLAVVFTLSYPLLPSDQEQAAWASASHLPLNDEPVPGKTYIPFVSYSHTVIADGSWPMVAANPERTSWTPTQVSGLNIHVEWYRPIEAYISQNVQIIASNGLLFISTAKGLYALNANNGAVVWRFDTELPLGNSPTVNSGVLYVGGHDRKLHALNALTGAHLWSFEGAQAGYDTNPLVVDGKVILGNRDGNMYAIGAQGTRDQGQLVWSFKAGGPIHLSAAYKSGIIYFAADDNYAYALNASTGALIWKSARLPGDGYHSYWPVIYQDKVVFSAAVSYRMGLNPGLFSIKEPGLDSFETVRDLQRNDIFHNSSNGALLGPSLPPQDWSHGYPVIDASRVTEYLENNPQFDEYKHKPWRRTSIVLNTRDGSEYTFDSDHDGSPEYIPIAYWGTNSGNRYPPVVGPDNILYQSNLYSNEADAQGRVMGWKLGTQYLSVMGAQGAVAEPQAISMGGNLIYRNLCCDRVGDYFDIRADGEIPLNFWSYNLSELAPGYDSMWTILPGWPRLQGWYKGNTSSVNGIYHNTGDQNPLIPYNGRVYVHRSNAIIAFGPGPALGKLPLLTIQNKQDNISPPSIEELKTRLDEEVQKMMNAGHLRPGYYNNGQFSNYVEFADYFDNPGDTLYTLSIAYPHLSPQLQVLTKAYLADEFSNYFDPTMYSRIGWSEGAPREAMPMPPEIQTSIEESSRGLNAIRFSWSYPQHNFYAMWKYASLVVPEQASHIYDLAKSRLQVPVPSIADNNYFLQRPYELNAYIAGYIGFLELQEMANKTQTDAQLRTTVTNELNRLQSLRVNNFNKNTPWGADRYHRKVLNVAQNFIMLVPELGEYLRSHALTKMQEAISEYEYVAPYWFVTRYESILNEGVTSPLYNYSALYQAKAYILNESRDDLTKYLDAPAFVTGDLFYIQNLVIAINAP